MSGKEEESVRGLFVFIFIFISITSVILHVNHLRANYQVMSHEFNKIFGSLYICAEDGTGTARAGDMLDLA